MSNHKWNKENKCVNCGIERKMSEQTSYGLPYSRLGSDGVFYDVTPKKVNLRYCYKLINGVWNFNRPDCKHKKVNYEQTN